MRPEIETGELLEATVKEAQYRIHTSQPGRVVSIDLAKRRADIELAYSEVLETEEGDPVVEKHPILRSVPIGFLRAGSARIEVPVAKGDWVMVHAPEWNLGDWLATGEVGAAPGDLQRHGLSGAYATPILFPDREHLTTPLAADGIVIGYDGASGTVIKVTETQVRLGTATAAEAFIRGTTHTEALNTFILALETLIGTISPAPSGVGVFTTAATTFKTHLSTTARSTKVFGT